jgi:hypothetical protein
VVSSGITNSMRIGKLYQKLKGEINHMVACLFYENKENEIG